MLPLLLLDKFATVDVSSCEIVTAFVIGLTVTSIPGPSKIEAAIV